MNNVTVTFADHVLNQGLVIEDDCVTFDLNGSTVLLAMLQFAVTVGCSAHFGAMASATGSVGDLATVPEPAAAGLALLTLVWFLHARRNRCGSWWIAVRSAARLLAVSALLASGSGARANSDVWEAPVSGGWGINSNWQDNSVPGNSDEAIFSRAGTYTVTFPFLNDPPAIQRLTLRLPFADEVNVNFTSGDFSPPRTLRINSDGVFNESLVVSDFAELTLGSPGGPNRPSRPLHLTADSSVVLEDGGDLNVAFRSQLVHSGKLVVGQTAGTFESELNITAGGEVQTISEPEEDFGGGEILEHGRVTVDGANSKWIHSSRFLLAVRPGGELIISNGGLLDATAPVGQIRMHVFSGGSVVVSGAGSQLNSGRLLVEGTLRIEAGGHLFSPSATVAAPGRQVFMPSATVAVATVRVAGAGSQWIISEDLNVGLLERGHVIVQEEGLLEVGRTLGLSSASTVTIDGGTLKVDSNGVRIGTITTGGTLNFIRGTLHLTDSDGYTVGAGAEIERVIGGPGPNVALANGRNLIVDQNISVPSGRSLSAIASDVRANGLINNGLVNLNDMTLCTTTGLANNADLVLIDTTVQGPVTNAAGSTVTVLGTANFNGAVSGPGNFFGPGTATFHGGMAPGASPAEIAFEGNVALSDTNMLFVEVGGTIPGAQFDALDIAGTASLGGALDVSLLGGFTPGPGDEFQIITADGGITGTFDTQLLPSLAGNFDWNVIYDADSVTLEVVAPGLPGDYNRDGTVDAADYVVLRNGLGTTFIESDYDVWRANFGRTAAGAAAAGRHHDASAAVPESATIVLFMLGTVGLLCCRTTKKPYVTSCCDSLSFLENSEDFRCKWPPIFALSIARVLRGSQLVSWRQLTEART